MYLTPRVNEDQTPPRIRHAITAWTVPQGWTEWAVHQPDRARRITAYAPSEGRRHRPSPRL